MFLIVTGYKQLHRNRYIYISITEEEAPLSPVNEGLAGRRVLYLKAGSGPLLHPLSDVKRKQTAKSALELARITFQ